ncbi:MAG TPA: hypothetical protein GX693_06355, partial [Firmicutes bacterium]|nr:hypothetical protein [Bacillota bacterium]
MKVWKRAPLFQALAVQLQRAYRNSAIRKWRFWLKGKRLHWTVYLTGVSLLVGGVLGVQSYLYSFYQVVLVDGQEIGLVRESGEVEEYVDFLTEKCSNLYNMPVTPLEEITCYREYRPGGEANLQLVKDTLRQQVTMVTEAVMITVDGEPVVPVKDEQEVDGVIDLLGQCYTSPGEGAKLLEVKLVEEIGGEDCIVKPEEIHPAEGVARLLAGGGQSRELYTVSRGDTLPNLTELTPDNDLPEVHLVTVEEINLEEKIPFSTSYTYTGNLWSVQSRVVSPGKPGTRQVVYHVTRENGQEISRHQVSETILEHPVTQVVERGSARVPSYGTGQFIWPIPYNVDQGGRITQGFRGYAHRGIDISSSAGTSTPIIAADSGVVVRTGYQGSLGNH